MIPTVSLQDSAYQRLDLFRIFFHLPVSYLFLLFLLCNFSPPHCWTPPDIREATFGIHLGLILDQIVKEKRFYKTYITL